MSKGKKIISIFLVFIFFCGSFFVYNNFILASDIEHIVISEIQIGKESVYDEFIELYNPTDSEIDLDSWDLKRKTKSGTESNILNNIKGVIPAYGYFLIVPRSNCGDGNDEDCYKGLIIADDEYTTDSFLAKDNAILLYDSDGNLVDKVGWGNAVDFESKVIGDNPEDDQSLERKGAGYIVQDTDNNNADFILQAVPNPQNSSVINDQNDNNEQEGSIQENGANNIDNETSDIDNEANNEQEIENNSNDIIITEFLPNPKGSDSDNEFIEIYNNGDIEINLEGWTLEDKTGSIKKFIISKGTKIGAKKYKIFYSSETKITLNNDGDGVVLRDGVNNIISETELSGLALEGRSYSLDGIGNWVWTLRITPEEENIIIKEEQRQDDEIYETGDDNDDLTQKDKAINTIPKIIITEFLSDPEDSDRDNEFIEIYNNDVVKVDLEDWTLEDKMGSTKKFIIPEGTEINIGKYRVFYSDETRITLNNSGDGVILRDAKNNIVDETPVSDLTKEEQSLALDENGSWILTLSPTPGRKNMIKSEENDKQEGSTRENGANSSNDRANDTDNGANDSYDFSDRIVVSEVYPNPIGNDNRQENYEWIEIYNNSDSEINLKGWQIDDILNKGSKSYLVIEDTIIKPGNFLVLENSQTKIVLNNSGDEINILWPDGTVVDNLKYERSKEGYSYNWVSDDSWAWSRKITPGNNNIVENNNIAAREVSESGKIKGVREESDNADDNNELGYIETNISELKDFDKYSRVKISGIVSTPVGIFSDRSFYLSGSGIQVYSYEIISKKFNIGDEIELTGRLSEVGGEKRILIDDTSGMIILSHDNLLKPKLISASDLTDELVGSLIIIEGKVSEVSKNLFYIDDGSGKVKIYIKPGTGIIISNIKKDNWITITGQVSKTSLGYRILPRFQNDIKLARTSGTSISGVISSQSDKNISSILKDTVDTRSFWNILFFSIIAMVMLDWGRMRIKNNK